MNVLKENIDWLAASYGEKETRALINDAMRHNLRVLCQEIIKTVPGVVSIYLTGGYAASEGTVIVEDREIKLLSDYDLVVITKGRASMASLKRSSLQKLRNIYEMPGHPIYEVFVWNINELDKLPPTKFLHDFQLARCIYGEEIRTMVPRISGSEIPLTEGLRLIFNRVFGALIPFSPSLLYTNSSVRRLRHLTFESVKLVLGSCEALLILEGIHSLTQKENVRLFQEKLFSRFPQLSQRVPSVSKLIEQALEYRLRPSTEAEKNALDIWFNSRDLALLTFELFIEKLYGIRQSHLEEMIGHFIHKNPHPFIFNIMATANVWRQYRRLHSKLLYKKPSNALLATRLYLLFSVDGDGKFDNKLLEKARNVLAEHMGIKVGRQDSQGLWEALKQYVLQNYFDPFAPVQLSLRRQIARFF